MMKSKCNKTIIPRHEGMKKQKIVKICVFFSLFCAFGESLGSMVSLTTLVAYLEVKLESFGLDILNYLLPMHQHISLGSHFAFLRRANSSLVANLPSPLSQLIM